MHVSSVMGCARGLLCCGMALCAGLVLASCDKVSQLTAGAPVIEIETDHLALGGIDSDAITEDFIRVYNRGESKLVITKIATVCHCTVGEMIEWEIPAGGEGVLRVTVYPSRVKGNDFTNTMTVFSNDPVTPVAKIEISAAILPGIEWEPRRLDFGEIPQGQGAEGRVRLRQTQNRPLQIHSDFFTGPKGYMVGEIVEIPAEEWAAPDKVEYDLIVRVLPETPVGVRRRNFMLPTNVRDGMVSFMAVVHIVPADGETAGEDTGAPAADQAR